MRTLSLLIALLAGSLAAGMASDASGANVPMRLDPSFGIGGRSLVDIGGPIHEDEPFTLIMQPDGKLVVPGKAYNAATGDFDFTVIRFNPNGTRDTSFDGDGVALTNIQGGYDEALGLVRQPDGKLVAAGFGRNPNTGLGDFALVRYNANGSLDSTFGTGGRVVTDFFGGDDQALGVVLRSNGKLVVGGFATAANGVTDFALAEYNADGSLDTGYGAGGRVTTDFFGSGDAITRMAIQPDQKVVAVGTTFNPYIGNHDFAVARYNPDGSLDASFATYGTDGIAANDFTGNTDYALSVLIQPDGKILAGGLGWSSSTGHYDFTLARYNADGTLDNTFATYGKPAVVTTDFFGNYDQILSLAVQPDGKILAGGHAKHPTRHFEFALVRYNADGTKDQTFGYGGIWTLDFFGGPDGSHGIVLQPDGKLVMAGDTANPATNGDDFALVRVLVADPSFIAGVVSGLSDAEFNTASSRLEILSGLALTQQDIAAGNLPAAISRLRDLRAHLDGCGTSPDTSDWIVDCGAQVNVRALVDQVIAKLGG